MISLCILFLTAGRLVQAKLTELLVNRVSSGSSQVMFYGSVLGILCAACVLVTAVKAKAAAHFTARFCERLKVQITEQILNCPYQVLLKKHAGDLLKTVNYDSEMVCGFVSDRMTGLISQVVMLLGAYSYLLITNPLVGLLTFLYTPFGMCLTYRINRKIGRYYPQIADEGGRAFFLYEQVIRQIPVIRSFHMEKNRMRKLMDCYERIAKLEKEASYHRAYLQTACSMTSQVPKLIFLVVSMAAIRKGRMTLGEMISIYEILNLMIAPTVYFPFLYDDVLRTKASWERVKRVRRLSDIDHGKNEPRNIRLQDSNMRLEVDQIVFPYNGEKKIVDGLSFRIERAGIYRLEGESGKGKTTILDLCAGLLTPDSGTIIRSGSICTMTQDTYLFYGT